MQLLLLGTVAGFTACIADLVVVEGEIGEAGVCLHGNRGFLPLPSAKIRRMLVEGG